MQLNGLGLFRTKGVKNIILLAPYGLELLDIANNDLDKIPSEEWAEIISVLPSSLRFLNLRHNYFDHAQKENIVCLLKAGGFDDCKQLPTEVGSFIVAS